MKKAILILLLLPIVASSQSFNVFDIDTSEYPIMKAKFYSVDEKGDQILNHTTSDFEITENGNPAEVLSVSCPEPNSEPISFVIAVDVSGSMSGSELNILKSSLKYFIDLIPNDGSELAIIAFNSNNHFVSDFTNNKSRLMSRVDALSAGGGTDFDAAFINPVAGALLAMENAKYQSRNVIIITDGKADGDENAIISKAKSLGTRVFGMLIKNQAPNILNNLLNKTGGISFENIITEDDYRESFSNISQIVGNDPCEITWKGSHQCGSKYSIEIYNKIISSSYKSFQSLNKFNTPYLNFVPKLIDFGKREIGDVIDTTINITSYKSDFIIENIEFSPDIGNISVINTLPIEIKNLEKVSLNITFQVNNLERSYYSLNVKTNCFEEIIGILVGDPDDRLANQSLELFHPNGGEVFKANNDTIITWGGLQSKDPVAISFSSDNGKNWEIISDSSVGLTNNWNINNVISDSCLILIEKFNETSNISKEEEGQVEWSHIYGGSEHDSANDVIETYDGGYLIVGHTRSSNGDLNGNQGDYDAWFLKVDAKGEKMWSVSFGGDGFDAIHTLFQDFDGGYIGIGNSSSNNNEIFKNKGKLDIWVVKISANGNLVWSKNIGSSKQEGVSKVIKINNNEYIMSGHIQGSNTPTGKYNYWILKINSDWEIVWSKEYGSSEMEITYSLINCSDGGYLIGGHRNKSDGGLGYNSNLDDYWILKLNSQGDIEWEQQFGGSRYERIKGMYQLNNGDYFIFGNSGSNDGDLEGLKPNSRKHPWLLKLNQKGEKIWSKAYYDNTTVSDVIQLNDDDFLLSGTTELKLGIDTTGQQSQNMLLFRINNKGDVKWEQTYGDENAQQGGILAQTKESSYISIGNKFGKYWLMKLFSSPSVLIQSDTSDAVFSIIKPDFPTLNNVNINMGQMIVGNTKDTIVSSIICNTGDAPLHVLGVDITGGDDADFLIPRGAGNFYLQKDQCQDMMFEFTPSALGNRTAVATIRTTIGDFTDTINIRGVGIDPLIEATSDVIDFGKFELGDSKDTNVVLIKNVGSEDIAITETKITGPDTEQFDMTPLPSFTLTSGEPKNIELNYTARYGGRTSSIIEFHYDGVGSPLRSMLFAEGIGGEVYPQVPDAYVGERVELGLHLGRIKPEGLDEVATNFTATVSYNSTLLAPIDKSMTVTTENTTSFIKIEGQLSGAAQIATVPMKVGLGTAISSGLVVTEFQLYDTNGDSVDYEIEPGVGEFNILGICEEGGTRLINPNSEQVGLKVTQDQMNTNATISLNLIESGQTDLIIYDQLGNAIETAYSGTPSTGTKELNIDLSNFANGRYYIKLVTPTVTKTEIIEVVR